MKPIISFITPVYNNEKLILNTAASILNQTDDQIEYIIVDDGSTDNTPKVVDEIAAHDDRVKVIHQDNQWIYASFNNGIKAARGEYIYIVNSDDTICEGVYEKLKEIINNYHPDVIWTKILVHKCDDEQNILAYDYKNCGEKVCEDRFLANAEETRKNWKYLVTSLLVQNQANLYKRELMIKHPFRNDVYGADVLFNISIARDIEASYILSNDVYNFFEYTTKGNASVGKFYDYEHDMFNDMLFEYEKMYRDFNTPYIEYQYIYSQRISRITHELRMLNCHNCKLTIEEKILLIFERYIDDIVYQCAVKMNKLEELESRVLSGLRELFMMEIPDVRSSAYFAYELLESLLRYEKDDEDYVKIKNAILNPINKYKIGKLFFDKLSGNNND